MGGGRSDPALIREKTKKQGIIVKHSFRVIAAAAISALVIGTGARLEAETPADTLIEAWAIDDIISLDPAEVFEFSAVRDPRQQLSAAGRLST